MAPAADRELDIVLLGATGFVGRLTAQHLARHTPEGVRIALAGRSTERLTQVRQDLGVDWPLITIDTSDEDAAAELAGRTRVLATTVGPYLRYGQAVARACARAGTDYADLTGESAFVRGSVESNHLVAGASGARIVHSCGFDSIPSDLGLGLAHVLVEGEIAEATYQIRSARGGISGGTVDSLRQQLVEAKTDPGLRAAIANPYAFTDRSDERPARRGGLRLRHDPRTGHWQAPFIMGVYNQQVVQRTNYLNSWAYGRDMVYREVVDTGSGPVGSVVGAGASLGQSALVAGLWLDPTRTVIDRLLPKPGQGPSAKQRSNGRFHIEVDVRPESGATVRTVFAADLDPGYDGTAVMLGESALCLLSDDLPDRAGVLTPMTAMGELLARRLRARGFTIETVRLS